MRRILTRISFIRRPASIYVNNTSRPRVGKHDLHASRAASAALFSNDRRFNLRKRKGIACLIRGGHATNYRFRASDFHFPYVNRNTFLMTRRLTFRRLFKGATRICHSGQLSVTKEVTMRRTNGRVLSNSVLARCGCINVHVTRLLRYERSLLRSGEVASGGLFKTSHYNVTRGFRLLLRRVCLNPQAARLRTQEGNHRRFFLLPQLKGRVHDPHFSNARYLIHVHMNDRRSSRYLQISARGLLRTIRAFLAASNVATRVRVRRGGIQARDNRGVLSTIKDRYRFCLLNMKFRGGIRHGGSVLIVVCGRCFAGLLRVYFLFIRTEPARSRVSYANGSGCGVRILYIRCHAVFIHGYAHLRDFRPRRALVVRRLVLVT